MEEAKILETLKQRFPGQVLETGAPFGDETAVIRRDALVEIVDFLRGKPFAFGMLLDLTCVDFPGRRDRFEIIYHLFSLLLNRRLRLKLRVAEDEAIDSLSRFWKNANWLEREAYDMFGIPFRGHPALRRLFMYDGFEGHPLRKDYPLRKRQPRIALKNPE